MATIAKSGTPSLSTPLPCAAQKITGLVAGEDIAAGDACYIKNDGKAWRTNGTAATAPALYAGAAAAAAKTNEAVTLMFGVASHYGSGLTPGARYYVSATPGAIDDAATTGGTVAVAFAIDTTQIFWFEPNR